jgi:hypothetical protein
MTDRLVPNGRLEPGASISADGYALIMQDDGNLVLYAPGNMPLTSFGWPGMPGTVLVMQDDGNLVLYAPGNRPVWATGTAGDRDSALVVQGDGNLVLYAPGNRPIWASGSQGGAPAKPDIVHVGREILSMGCAVAGHSKFPPVGRHTPTSWHYKDRALDINWYPGSDEGPKLDDLHGWIQRRAPRRTELLWRVDGHHDHLHLAIA